MYVGIYVYMYIYIYTTALRAYLYVCPFVSRFAVSWECRWRQQSNFFSARAQIRSGCVGSLP